jgi:hypothetical protein
MDNEQHVMDEVDITTRDSKYNALELDFSTKQAMRIVCRVFLCVLTTIVLR